jgi:hypothetical protein
MNSEHNHDFPPGREAGTLARRLGTTPHISPLLMKARRMGLARPEDLENLTVRRGLRYYDAHGDSMVGFPNLNETQAVVDITDFSNEELALALLSPAAPYSLQRLRMGAAMLAAAGNRPEYIARLARLERCESVVRYISRCGMEVEPDNPFWVSILDHLPQGTPSSPDALPHLSRFVAMTGLSRAGKGRLMQWIRPTRMQNA